MAIEKNKIIGLNVFVLVCIRKTKFCTEVLFSASHAKSTKDKIQQKKTAYLQKLNTMILKIGKLSLIKLILRLTLYFTNLNPTQTKFWYLPKFYFKRNQIPKKFLYNLLVLTLI